MFKGDWGIPQLAEDAWGAHPCTASQFVKQIKKEAHGAVL